MDTVSSVLAALFVFMCLFLFWLWFCFGKWLKMRQKTRMPHRRQYMGSRPRQSLSPGEPTIYVSPANLPPPPKYEVMAPPSYEEAVGIHYPSFQPSLAQPITRPITTAMAQSSNSTDNVSSSVTVTVTEEITPAVAIPVAETRSVTSTA